MLNPKISVIIPIYNVEYYLEETLNSILNQTFIDNIEVLMIDDGSDDSSRLIMEKFAKKYDNFYAFFTENTGVCATRNFGLDVAKGEYIHFMDSDDFLIYDTYEKLYKLAKKGNCDVVTSGHLRYDSKKTWTIDISTQIFDISKKNIENTNMTEHPELSWDMPLWNKIIKREFLSKNNIRFYHKQIVYSDNLFMIEVYSKAKNVTIMNDTTYCWREREVGTSMTRDFNLNRGNQIHEMATLVNNFLIANVSDKNVLTKKYTKLLIVDLFVFIMKVKREYPKENHEYLFESVYNIINLVPMEYINNMNSYYRTIYKMALNKDWNDLYLFASYKYKYDQSFPEGINQNYLDEINFREDSYREDLRFAAKKAFIENNELVIEFVNYVPYYNGKFDKMSYRWENENLLDNFKVKGNRIYIPLNSLSSGDNNIICECHYDNIKKESPMKTEVITDFSLDKVDIEIKKDILGYLHIIKREKNDLIITIDDIELNDNTFHFKGHSNKTLDNVCIIDSPNILKFTYDLKYVSENEFYFDIDYNDFMRSPIKKWKLSSDEIFDKITLNKDFEFINDKYKVSIKNNENKINFDFELHNHLEEYANPQKAKLTVIIPVFNAEKYLSNTFDSLLTQSIGFENLEVIFVDDCSTDNSRDIITNFSKQYPNVKVVFLNKNSGGAGRPRNVGMEYSTSDYVMFLDSDDIFINDACETVYNEITENGIDIVSGFHTNDGKTPHPGLLENTFTDPMKSFPNRNKKVKEMFKDENSFVYVDSINECESIIDNFGLSSKIFRKSFLEENNITFPDSSAGEDSVFLCNSFLNAKGIKFVNKYVYRYFLDREESLTHVFSKDIMKIRLDSYYKMYYLCANKNKIKMFKHYALHGKLNYFTKKHLLVCNLPPHDVLEVLEYAQPLFKLYMEHDQIKAEHYELYEYIANKEYELALEYIYRGKNVEIPKLKHIVLIYKLENLNQLNQIYNHFHNIKYSFKHIMIVTDEDNLFLPNTILESELNNIKYDDNHYFYFVDDFNPNLNIDEFEAKSDFKEVQTNFKNSIISNNTFKKLVSSECFNF